MTEAQMIGEAKDRDWLEMPAATKDWDQAKADLAKFGLAIVEDALTPRELKALRGQIVEQALGGTRRRRRVARTRRRESAHLEPDQQRRDFRGAVAQTARPRRDESHSRWSLHPSRVTRRTSPGAAATR